MRIKKSLIKVVCSVVLGLGFSCLLIWLFSGPRLDFVYDFLMSRRAIPEASPEIVLIDTAQDFASANISDPALIASVLMTLAEFGAGPTVIQTSVFGLSPAGTEQDDEIVTQVSDEFSRIEENIDSLFSGIRTGSISPQESELYVDELITLIERGKNRLVSSVTEQELAGLRFFEDAVRIKHDVWVLDEIRLNNDDRLNNTSLNSVSRYTSYRPDSDGVLRRINPIMYLEDGTESHYLMYDAIKTRLNPSDFVFSADKNGAVLLDGLGKDIAFRRFSLDDFVTYNELEEILFQKFEAMETLGYYDGLNPEEYPTALYRYVLAMRDDLFREASSAALEDWLESREDYFHGVNDFFLSGTETKLVTSYEELIASDELEDSAKEQLVSMRDSLIKQFQECRDAYDNVLGYRENLQAELAGAFCILGQLGTIQSSWGTRSSGNPGETEAAALFANSFLTGNTITPVKDVEIIFWIFLWIFFLSFFIRNANIIVTIILGIIAAMLSIVFFSSLFVYWDLWIHPAIPVGSILCATLVTIVLDLFFKRRLELELRRAYSPYVSSSMLKKIIKRTVPEPWETLTSYSAIAAVRSSAVHNSESKDSPVMAALAVRKFRDEVSELFKNEGAVIIGSDGDLVLAAFASPLERSALRDAGIAHQYMKTPDDNEKVNPADKAISAVQAILNMNIDVGTWTFGIDIGECAFTYSDASGYSAFGHAVVKARILSSLAHKYNAKILISENVTLRSKLPIETRQLDILVERELGTKEAFFELK
jgi:class 3 adenylate cyclase